MIRTLLATDPALLDCVPAAERQRAMTILNQIFPISRKVNGLRTDGFWAGIPTLTTYERIAAPTLILSCEDDLFGAAATARLLAERIRHTDMTIYPTGGHIWLGYDDEVAERIADFVRGTAAVPGVDQDQRGGRL
jgi:pimeloyl-ACP methyl ester carboxylesterase